MSIGSGPRRCPACGGELVPWRTVPSAEPGLGRYELRRCRRCASAWTVGAAGTEAHEAGAYRPGAPRLHRLAAPLLAAFDRQRIRLLARAVAPPARVLDAGAGRGRWVAAAARAGYDAFGIEPSRRGAEAATELGADVTRVDIAGARVPAGSLDAVSLWHVLEHLEDPEAALRTMYGWLRPGGALLLGAPNLASVQARLGGERWYHLDVPRHRGHYTPAGVRALLERTGFEVLGETHLLLEHNPFGMWQTIVSRATRRPSYLYHLLKRNAPLASADLPVTILGLILLPAALALEALAGRLGRGGTIAVLARRRSGSEDRGAPSNGE